MARDAEKLAGQAERLRELKKLGRVTFSTIAQGVGVTERQVQRWMAGESDIEPQNLKRLADFLGSTPDYIEYGRIRRHATPDLSLVDGGGGEDRIGEVLERLTRLEEALEGIRLRQLDAAAHAVEALRRLDEMQPPSSRTQAPPPP